MLVGLGNSFVDLDVDLDERGAKSPTPPTRVDAVGGCDILTLYEGDDDVSIDTTFDDVSIDTTFVCVKWVGECDGVVVMRSQSIRPSIFVC